MYYILLNPDQFTAASASLGYYYQSRVALLLFLKSSPNSKISLESIDDISFENNDTSLKLIQTKHKTNYNAPLSDASTDLWKTLRIWSNVIIDDSYLDDTTFTLITNATAPNNSAASKLQYDKTKRNETDALKILQYVARKSSNKINKNAYNDFMQLDEKKQFELLQHIHILDSSSNIVDIRKEIINELKFATAPKFHNNLFTSLEGWWIDIVIKQLSKQLDRPILYKELRAKIIDLQKQFIDDNLPIDFINAIVPSEKDLSKEQKIFIEQLRLICLSDPRIKQAISDYHKAYEQRSKWIREELVMIDELEKYDNTLINEWSEYFNSMKEELDPNPDDQQYVECGRKLYNKIRDLNIKIRPKVIEQYVSRGSYHMLSNNYRVGWHIKFQSLLHTSPRSTGMIL